MEVVQCPTRSQGKGARVKRRKSRLRRTRANQAARIRAREVREAVWGGCGVVVVGGKTPLDCMCCTGVYTERGVNNNKERPTGGEKKTRKKVAAGLYEKASDCTRTGIQGLGL